MLANKILCGVTGNSFEFVEETVGEFLKRNDLETGSWIVVHLSYEEDLFKTQKVLELQDYLVPVRIDSHAYYITQPEKEINIKINAYGRYFLQTEKKEFLLYCSKETSSRILLKILKKYLPKSKHFHEFFLYTAKNTEWGVSLRRLKTGEAMEMHSTIFFQARDPFSIESLEVPSFNREFLYLPFYSTSISKAKVYTIMIHGHFIVAKKKNTKIVELTMEITDDLRVFKQVLGNKEFAVLESLGVRWTLYSPKSLGVFDLFSSIANAPRYKHRDIEIDQYAAIQSACTKAQKIMERSESVVSFPTLSSFLPEKIPRTNTYEESSNALLARLEKYLQKSVWDNVNIEFILYLLAMRKIIQAESIHKEVREFGIHRKKILSQLRESIYWSSPQEEEQS
ncbi:hypothetical protein NEFER03_0997 [Nematocida sp. LUAm3]|nr:hypothetical protein NEFER03_0997 [Nematocida sp. LUAm3]KAI5175399.1 hypothetical protein NEFER02_1328 [Nematocida sp. LUAm2]KAI5177644.1 hypothetical protein NEFER01_0868 [Nematocida sp. LUAm1]